MEDAAVGAALGGGLSAALRGAQRFISSPTAQRVATTGATTGGGALVGSALPGDDTTGAAGGAAAGALTGILGPRRVARTVADFLRRSPPERAQTIAGLAQRGGITSEQAQQAIARLNEPGAELLTLSDVLPENLLPVAFASTTRPGPAASAALQRLEERAAGESGRVQEGIRRGLAQGEIPADLAVARQGLEEARAAASAPLYEQAISEVPVIESKKLSTLLSRPSVQSYGIPRAATRAGDQGRSLDLERRGPNLFGSQSLHDVQQGLREQAEVFERGGDFGRARDLREVRDQILAEIETQNPLYQQARVSYAQGSGLLNAIDTGANYRKLSPAELRDSFKKLSPAEQEQFRRGAFYQARDIAQDVPDALGATTSAKRKLAGDPAERERLSIIFGSPDEFRNFERAIENEDLYRRTNQAVRRNSETARRQAGETLRQEILGEAVPSSIGLGDIATGARRAFASTVGRNVQRRADVANEQLADFLLSPAGDEQISFLTDLLRAPGSARLSEQAAAIPLAARGPRTRIADRGEIDDATRAALADLVRRGGRAARGTLVNPASPALAGAFLGATLPRLDEQ